MLSTPEGVAQYQEFLRTQPKNQQTPGLRAAEEKAERQKEEEPEEIEFEGMTEPEIKELIDAQIYKKPESGFPKLMRKQAFTGIAGEIVDLTTDPKHSELCREAVLVQFLVSFGNMLGRGPYMWQEATHHTNEFVAIVGKTSSGAKGGSIKAVKSLLRSVDDDYVMNNAGGGFQSGEAVVEAIKDDSEIIKENGDTNEIPGVEDKRLLIIEEELSRLLKLGARQGSILSEVMRLAFDSDIHLKARSKKYPLEASFPHISLIGHITPEELKECMKNADIYNGFANRILSCASRRSGKIPRPKRVVWSEHPEIVVKLRAALNDFGPDRAETIEALTSLTFSEEAESAWDSFYYENESESERTGGVLGAIVARGKAHVLRLSLIYAILDHSEKIEARHIESAKAVWEYCKGSARWAFGENSGNRTADDILWALKRSANGLTKTEISVNVLRKNVSGTEIDRALAILRESGHADFTTETPANKIGRPKQTWFAALT
jgi:hypothetical protein